MKAYIARNCLVNFDINCEILQTYFLFNFIHFNITKNITMENNKKNIVIANKMPIKILIITYLRNYLIK